MKRELTVLIIDDEQADHDLACDFLQEDKEHVYRFLHAYDGASGEALYRDNKVDCLLLDYHLPGMDGLAVLRRLSENGQIVPVVMLTGGGDETVAVSAMKLGSQDYLSKKGLTAAALRRSVLHAAERVNILRQMETYRLDLERSNNDLELFANVAAHDLKAPLRAVTQHLTIVKMANADKLDERSLRSIEFAVDGANRMRQLIEGLFDYSRIGFAPRQMMEAELRHALEDARRNLASIIEETGALLTADPLPTVTCDRAQVAQLLQNLIANALKFCKGTPRIHVGARRENGRWVISVRDNGIGIPPQQHDKIFTVFRRLHAEEDYPGTGIGLTICKRVVENHGGRIWVESEPGEGSTFYFTLPAQAEERQAAHG